MITAFIKRAGPVSALIAGCVACASSTYSTPNELTDARLTFGRVSGGPAAKLVPAQVHVARRALDDAEKSFTRSSPDRRTFVSTQARRCVRRKASRWVRCALSTMCRVPKD